MGLSEGALFYICVVHTGAPSNTSQSVMLVYVSAKEEQKIKDLYACEERHATFTPLVVSVDGVFVPKMNSFFKVLID